MDYNDVRERFVGCPAFQSLDEMSRAILFWKGREFAVPSGSVIYSQDDPLDNCFYLVLSGEFVAEQNGRPVGTVTEGQIFGEMAFLNPVGTRLATIRAGSDGCIVFRFELSQNELGSPGNRPLKDYFKSEAWGRIVSNAQAGA